MFYYKQIFSESGETIVERPNTYLTFGASVTDNLGNLEPKSRMYITTYGEYDSSTINFYYRKNPTLSAKEKVNSVACFVANMRFSPAIGIYLGSDAYTNRYIDFNISITDVYLYEGLYIGAKPSMDWASLTGIGTSYLEPNTIETFMLPEHLPFRARAIIYDSTIIKQRYDENPNCQWVAIKASEKVSSSSGNSNHIFKGSLYLFPIRTEGAFRKFDILCYTRRKSSAWNLVKATCTLDSSYSIQTSSFPANQEPNIELVSDRINNYSTFSIRFKRLASDNTTLVDYSQWAIRFYPEMIIDANDKYWSYIPPSAYIAVF